MNKINSTKMELYVENYIRVYNYVNIKYLQNIINTIEYEDEAVCTKLYLLPSSMVKIKLSNTFNNELLKIPIHTKIIMLGLNFQKEINKLGNDIEEISVSTRYNSKINKTFPKLKTIFVNAATKKLYRSFVSKNMFEKNCDVKYKLKIVNCSNKNYLINEFFPEIIKIIFF